MCLSKLFLINKQRIKRYRYSFKILNLFKPYNVMKKSVKLSQWALILFMALAFYTCKKAESPNPTLQGPPTQSQSVQNPYTPPAIAFKTQVMGFVYNENGQPVQGVKVSGGGQTAITDNYGAFLFNNAAFTGDFCYIKAEKNGYFIGSNTVHGEAGQELLTEITMQAQGNIVVYPSGEAKEIVLSNGSVVSFPANAIKKADGSLYNGNVHVAVATIHPDDKNFLRLIPVGDLRAYTLAGENVQLYSFGMLNVELFDDAGNKLQLTEGKAATLTFPISPTQIAEATATMPLWFFDEEKGVWIEDGMAYKKGSTYVGNVKHFTPFNIDRPENRARIKAKIINCYGTPLANAAVKIGQGSYHTNSFGEFTGLTFANTPFEIEYYDKDVKGYTVIHKLAGAEGNNALTNLGIIRAESVCETTIITKVVDCAGKPFTGYAIISSPNLVGSITTPVIGGELNITSSAIAANNIEISLYSPNTQAIVVRQVLIAQKTVNNIDKIVVCPENVGANKIGFSFSYTDGQITKKFEIKKPNMAVASYSPSKNVTTVTFVSDNTPADNISISFSGKLQGSFENTDTKKPAVNMDLKSLALGVKSYTDKVTVTAYGNVGEEIKGTFTGRYLFSDNRMLVPKAMMITQGNFTAVRLPDVQ